MSNEVTKHCSYKHELSLVFDGSMFKLHPSLYYCFDDAVGILFDISGYSLSTEKLSLKFCKKEGGTTTLFLDTLNENNKNEEILRVTIEDQLNHVFDALVDASSTLEPSFPKKIKATLDKIFEAQFCDLKIKEPVVDANSVTHNGYSITFGDKCIDVLLNIESTQECAYTAIVNPKACIQNAVNTIYGIDYRQFGVFLNFRLVNESMRFIDCHNDSSDIIIRITEKCHMTAVGVTETTVVLPRTKGCFLLAKELSNYMNEDIYGIRLFDEHGTILHDDELLDINRFRAKIPLSNNSYMFGDESIPIRIYYNRSRSSTLVRFISMQKSTESFEMVVPQECLVSELRRRLHLRLDIDPKRILIFQNDKIPTDDSKVSIEEEVIYFVAKLVENSGSKKFISQGSYGQIFKYSKDSSTDSIALKEFKLPSKDNTFIREVLVLSSLEIHPNIVRYLDIYIDDEIICIGMEYVPGGSLRDYLKTNGYLKEEEIKTILFHIVHGLKYLHDNKIMHRDIKGSNVLLGENNIAKLCDFGLSKMLTNLNTLQLSRGVTQTSECGTRRWMAPEVILGERYALKADIWSVGATVVEMITGEVPYHKWESLAAFYKIAMTKRIDYTSPYSMSEELQDFVNACLQPNTADRPNVTRLLELDLIRQ